MPHASQIPDYTDDVDETRTDTRPRKGSAPRPLPRFIQAETVMPTVSYRAPMSTPRAASPQLPLIAPPSAPIAKLPPPAPVRFVSAPQEPSVVEMLPRAPRATNHAPVAPAPMALPARRGELTVVLGCRGGAGATTLAVNTAAALARGGKTVCIVDLDLQLGDVLVALDLESQTSLSAVAREAGALDAASLRRRLAQHGSGVCALSQAGHLDDLDGSLTARLPELLDALRAHFDHVIVDGVRDFGDVALAALEVATRILVVVTQDVPAVRRAARALDVLGRLGIEQARCALVINRAVKRAAIDTAAIERALAMRVTATVREDAKVSAALDAGALLIDVARSRPVADDVIALANLCRGNEPQRGGQPPRRRFPFFGGR